MSDGLRLNVFDASLFYELGQKHSDDNLSVYSVQDAIEKILKRYKKAGKIKKLRLFGHGNPGCIILGGNKSDDNDLSLKMIGKSVTNEGHLKRLHGCFLDSSRAELHCCQRESKGSKGLSRALIIRLADIWNTKVAIGVGLQEVGGKTTTRFEGKTYLLADGRGAGVATTMEMAN